MRALVLALVVLAGCDRATKKRAAPDAALPVRIPDAAPPPPDAAPPRLAWVNPARCARPCAYEPPDLVAFGEHRVVAAVVDPLERLIAAAKDAGFTLKVESAYRSYDEQAEIFRTTKQIGRAARPGHSEHQLGTAVDLDLPTKGAVAWLAEHAAEFGFVVSYPPDSYRITGYRPENWHVRYVGDDLAAQLGGRSLEALLRAQPGLGGSGTCDDCPSEISRAPCGDVPAEGRCQGDVLSWCYDGALTAVHCGTMKKRCAATDAGADCVE